ncbi:MAG: septum formation protein Maf [Chitinophagia bacterium]|nr:septum formation protein Maf [Chitinophagia bacterium]
MSGYILASQSPRRKQLLAWADIEFDIIVSAAAEDYPSDMDLQEVPVHIAKKKAIAVQEKIKNELPIHQGKWIIAADTIVVLENEIIGKPIDRADAISILQKLSGKSHRVITGVYIINESESRYFSETTLVHFHPITLSQIEYYVDQYQPFDKAGAYGIQDWIGVVGIRGIEGDFYNVMGLPVSKLLGYLPTTHSTTTTK